MNVLNQKEFQNLPFGLTILIYLYLLYLLLIDALSTFSFAGYLLLMNIFLIGTVLILFFTKTSIPKRSYVFSMLLAVALLVYESPLTLQEETQYKVTEYVPSEELFEGTGIFTLAVGVWSLGNVENEEVLMEVLEVNDIDFYEINPLTSDIRPRTPDSLRLLDLFLVN